MWQKNVFSCISLPTIENKLITTCRDRNKHQRSLSKSQNEPITIAFSSKRVKKSKHTDHIDDNEKDAFPIPTDFGHPVGCIGSQVKLSLDSTGIHYWKIGRLECK